MAGKRCTKGKSCGATCIDRAERCVMELGPEVSKAMNAGALFARGVEQGKAKSLPPGLLAEIKALGPPPWATPEESGDTRQQVLDDISRVLRGSGEMTSGSGMLSGDLQVEAEDFDLEFDLEDFRRVGSRDYDGWGDSYGSKAKGIAEGAYGAVVRNPDGTYVKRGDISDKEAELIDVLGKVDLGPRLVAADIDGPARYAEESFVDMRNGRIAMSQVEGRPMGAGAIADTMIGGKKAADIYWKAMGDLHRQGIAHNDAHIDNIMVDSTGKGRWVDLGLAQGNQKAALSEALGVFTPPKGSTASPIDGSQGRGNWQTGRWRAPNVTNLNNAKQAGGDAWRQYQERYPIASRVWQNKDAVVSKLKRMGLSDNEIATMMTHGIRAKESSYNQGPWAKITNEQAQDVIRTLYDGI